MPLSPKTTEPTAPDPAQYAERKAEVAAVLQRFAAQRLTPALSAEIKRELQPLFDKWDAEGWRPQPADSAASRDA